MAIEKHKLAALKAIWFKELVTRHMSSGVAAMKMLDSAIDTLLTKKPPNSRFRLAFFYLMRSGIELNGKPESDRYLAKQICNEISSPMYDYYLDMIEAVIKPVREAEREKKMSAYGSYTKDKPSQSDHERLDFLLLSIGEKYSSLHPKEVHFIENMKLKQVLETV